MIQIEKDEILQQVGSVLHLCHQIVSRLSRFDCSSSTPFCSWREESLNDSLRREEDCINDEDEDEDKDVYHQDDLWWDDVYPPLHFYTLVYDDDDLSLYDVDTSNFSLQQSAMREDEVMQSPMMENEVIQSTVVEDGLMQSVLQFLHDVIPNSIYDPNWREKQKRKAVHPVFYSIWCNFDAIFSDTTNDEVAYTPVVSGEEIRYCTIDIANVNARFIGNIPTPSYFPIHGVSADPDFYHKLSRGEGEESHKQFYKFNRHSPFGREYGYQTDVGIVPPPTAPIHGYVWKEGSWILHAVQPGERSSTTRRRRG